MKFSLIFFLIFGFLLGPACENFHSPVPGLAQKSPEAGGTGTTDPDNGSSTEGTGAADSNLTTSFSDDPKPEDTGDTPGQDREGAGDLSELLSLARANLLKSFGKMGKKPVDWTSWTRSERLQDFFKKNMVSIEEMVNQIAICESPAKTLYDSRGKWPTWITYTHPDQGEHKLIEDCEQCKKDPQCGFIEHIGQPSLEVGRQSYTQSGAEKRLLHETIHAHGLDEADTWRATLALRNAMKRAGGSMGEPGPASQCPDDPVITCEVDLWDENLQNFNDKKLVFIRPMEKSFPAPLYVKNKYELTQEYLPGHLFSIHFLVDLPKGNLLILGQITSPNKGLTTWRGVLSICNPLFHSAIQMDQYSLTIKCGF